MARALVIQLARLGDLLQTVPAIAAIKSGNPGLTVDLLCPSQLSPIGRMLPGIANVLEWDGNAWQRRAQTTGAGLQLDHIKEAERHICSLSSEPYDCAYVLNQHPRALLAGGLLAREVKGPRLHGPLDEQLTPWASYVREVAKTRRGRHVHLADAFCGLCGVYPPGQWLRINVSPCPLPSDLEHIGKRGGPWIGLIVGAGDAERLVPLDIWRQWITRFLKTVPRGRIVLIGQEQERGQCIQDTLPPSVLGRIWDATGRTSLYELATVLARCHTVIGADTGPLHLAAAVGTKVIGWYFARARVHETGPYGTHHLIWQAIGDADHATEGSCLIQPRSWPVEETIASLVNHSTERMEEWSLWESHCDRWGAYYTEIGQCPTPPQEREALWRELQPAFRS
jgi:ADP-heptose:LPS heptosyltransferase